MRYVWIVWLGLAAYAVLVAAVLYRFWHARQLIRTLRWGPSITQRQMEQYGTAFLERMGWTAELISSHGGNIGLYQCLKHDDHLYVLFARHNSSFSRLMNELRRQGAWLMSRAVIILYEPQTEMMIASAREIRLSLMHFSDLPRIEELHRSVLPRVSAAREQERAEQQEREKGRAAKPAGT